MASVPGLSPKSIFQLAGPGAVGPGSLRGMPLLTTLRDRGFAVWPFDPVGPRTAGRGVPGAGRPPPRARLPPGVAGPAAYRPAGPAQVCRSAAPGYGDGLARRGRESRRVRRLGGRVVARRAPRCRTGLAPGGSGVRSRRTGSRARSGPLRRPVSERWSRFGSGREGHRPGWEPMTSPAILVEDLAKRYGEVEALCAASRSQVPTGTVLGLLGPNGAGKTTAVRILTTLLLARRRPGGGPRDRRLRRPERIRASIGLAGQNAAVDENLTGRENLRLVGRLTHLEPAVITRAQRRAARPVRPRRRRRPPGAHLLGRHAPAPRPRRRARAPAAGALPRRTDHRARPAEPHRAVGGDRGARRARDHRAAHDAVPGGGRPAGEPDRGHRPRHRHRRGNVVGAEGPARRDRDRGRLRRSRRRGARRGRTRGDRFGDRRRPAAAPERRRRGRPRCSRSSACSTPSACSRSTMALREPTLDDVFLEPHRPRGRGRRQRRREARREHVVERTDAAVDRRAPALACPAPPGLGRVDHRVAQPAEHPAQPAAARVRHDPAGHLRAACSATCSAARSAGSPAVRPVHQLPHARDLRADGRVRLADDGRRPRRGPAEGPGRPVPVAADGALGGAGRAHARRPRAQPLRRAAHGRRRLPRRLATGDQPGRGGVRHGARAGVLVLAVVDVRDRRPDGSRQRDRAGGVVPDPRPAGVRVVRVRAGRDDAGLAADVRGAPAGLGRRATRSAT